MKYLAALSCLAAVVAISLAGCSSRPVQAPVIDRTPLPAAAKPVAPAATDVQPDSYIVKRGDTLYSIALDHGLDYKEFAAWNNLDNPNVIRVGQALRLKPPVGAPEAKVTVTPVTEPGSVTVTPVTSPGSVAVRPLAEPGAVRSEPQARKLPYSAENLALIQGGSVPPKPGPKTEPEPTPAQAGVPKPEPAAKADVGADDEDKVDWGWPARGKIVAGFSEATNKGMDIAGKLGDPVLASAPGRVVYSGSGLRGYGKLVIIKHNKTYLSAYAHNRDILVKEGQNVVKGQKIAEIGNTDADAPKLHFEIRKFGKPIDPSKLLPSP